MGFRVQGIYIPLVVVCLASHGPPKSADMVQLV